MGHPSPAAVWTWMFLLLLLEAWTGRLRAQESKVLGGQECEAHSQPWQTALFQGIRLLCGGVLIDENWVLTAAHCKKQKYTVRLGDHSLKNKDSSEQEMAVAQSIPHPCYNSSNEDHSHDLMLIRLRGRASLGPKVKPINLADHCPEVGQKCTISGWGTITSPRENFPDTLNCAEVEIFPQKKCQDVYPGQVTDAMICAGNSNGADSCQEWRHQLSSLQVILTVFFLDWTFETPFSCLLGRFRGSAGVWWCSPGHHILGIRPLWAA
ncbi:kallikrein-8 isoform X1 [Ailuropoda melanoleuca]|uniref:Kallikrein related peptidase 8 n=1 Tax=Ailuropoda melanoleuca TaxID=9646 RepID=A0A7N5KQV3_AILME|nr:kallikrein-8 isoform X1 [Ailuropoda melanoleuca]